MISKVITASVRGISAMRISVETDISRGLPQVTVVGLGDAAKAHHSHFYFIHDQKTSVIS